MEATQSFRLIGTSDIKNIPCDHIDGQGIVYWDDIDQVFPGVKYVERGNVAINLLRDSNRVRIVPHCIKHHPDVVLDVVLASSTIASPAGSSSRDLAIETTIPSGASNDTIPSPGINMSPKPASLLSQTKALESDIEERLMASLSPEDQAHVQTSLNGRSIVQAIKEGQAEQSSRLSELFFACFQELKEEIIKNAELVAHMTRMQEKAKQLQIQAPCHLTLLAKRIQLVLAQTYGLPEYPIPRMFIVLPKDSSGWDYTDPSANKFRLYFLCECEEQTISTNSRIPQHIHLAQHEGYDIPRSSEFFQLYGSYVLTILRMLKLDIPVAGVHVPALMHLIHTDLNGQPAARLEELAVGINRSMNQVISYIEKVMSENGNSEAWEGMDPHKFKAFLKSNDGNKALGDLHRVVTAQDHTKWVCTGHHRENYKMATESFSNMVTSLKGSFDEHVGRVHVALSSKALANQFYLLLEKTKSVFDLKIELNWDTTHSDFSELRDVIYKTNIEVMELAFGDRNDLAGDILIHAQRYDPILDIMRRPSIKTFTLTRTPTDFFSRSSLSYCRDGFGNLKHLGIDLLSTNQVPPGLKSLVAKTPNLIDLDLIMYSSGLPAVYGAIMEHQICPIFFKNQSLRFLPPTSDVRQAKTIIRNMEDLFRIHGRQVEAWDLTQDWMNESVLKAFVETARDGSQLKELFVSGSSLHGQSVESLSSILIQSEIRRLKICMNGETQREGILRSIQWSHIRELDIEVSYAKFDAVMRAVVDNMKGTAPEIIELEHFRFCFRRMSMSMQYPYPLSLTESELLRPILFSRKLKHLELDTWMPPEGAISLLKSIDVSRLQHLKLLAQADFSTAHVQTVLDIVEHSPDLRTVDLRATTIDKKQKEQMNAREVLLIP